MTEEEYDSTWAAKAAAFAKEVRAAGSSCVITIDFECDHPLAQHGRSTGSTIELAAGEPGGHVRLMAGLAHSGGNVDRFMMSVAKLAEKEGHSSVVLRLMGIPETPS